MRAISIPPPKPDLRSQVEELATGLRGHLQPLTIEEDDEKISITMRPCGSGERIILNGGYQPKIGLSKIKEPHHITWGMKDFPVYCVHCPVLEMLDIENNGNFSSVHIVTEPIHEGSCHFTIFKDPVNIPDECYTRIGKHKPSHSD